MANPYQIVIEIDNPDSLQEVFESYKSGHSLGISSISEESEADENLSRGHDWRKGKIGVGGLKMEENGKVIVSEFVGHGTIHLFRVGEASNEEEELMRIPGDNTMVSILFVPTYLSAHDLLHSFLGNQVVTKISHFRVIRSFKEMGYKFMLLMKFRNAVTAKQFKEQYDGRAFNALDPETCHVVFIKEVVFRRNLFPIGNDSDSSFPYLLHDPFTNVSAHTSVELPSCPVCLERMDAEVTGLVTIPCQHTFHCQCLDKWKDTRCPVCRFSGSGVSNSSVARQGASCIVCGAQDNSWICLICGNVGCGRYNSKHAIQHFEATGHCFAMDVTTQRVWDYAGDNYVHRLVQNEVDGKLVEVGSSSRDGFSKRNKEYHLEYVQVLVSQLESQREYYESKLDMAVKNTSNTFKQEEASAAIEALRQQVMGLELKASASSDEHSRKFQKLYAKLEDERRNTQLLRQQLKEEQMVSSALQKNVEHFERSSTKLEEQYKEVLNEKSSLQEQVTDLMFYLEARDKFKDADENVKQGTVVVKKKKGSGSKRK
ncbi:LAMI_0F10462g1_1 [Lachancea mirantina]|uniref:LAMI_0F10462g1_1 n=1 Tax=Lachancea mirantina TaxID=1230905 RepID=A0A1G4K1S6_9SACH|nr:LAMI_0F10462g1_1 [Lachancea mirantina]